MIRLSYRSSKTEVHESKIRARGLFATADNRKAEMVAVKRGHVADRKMLRENVRSPSMTDADDYLVECNCAAVN
jgi:hypothetical protein